MTKAELREVYLQKRKLLSEKEVADFSAEIFTNFFEKFKVSEGMKIHVFQSITKFREVNTAGFIQEVKKRKGRIFVPKMIDSELISVEILEDTVFSKNSWGISEPVSNEDSGVADFDYIITPLLYCDEQGNRIGYGKGFYDRFFSRVTGLKVGVGFFLPNEIIDDVSETDVPLDYLVTPEEVLSFGNLKSKLRK